jgi:hypothetical protein
MTHIADNIFVVFIVIFGIVFILALISLPTVIAFLINRWLTKKGIKYIGTILLVIAPLWTIYETYTAIYPTDSFYLDEFKEVTLREAPKTAEVLKKTASYPDLHGEYCSTSLIKLSRQDYTNLLNELSRDKRLIKNGELITSSEFDEIMGKLKTEQIKYSFTRQITGEEDHYLYIGFLDDQETIIVYVLVS